MTDRPQAAVNPEEQDVLESLVGIGSPEIKNTGVLPVVHGNTMEPVAEHVGSLGQETKASLGAAEETTQSSSKGGKKTENVLSEAV